MTSTQQLLQAIDTLKAEGHQSIKVTQLPSSIKRKRKSVWSWYDPTAGFHIFL